jgi:6,7-dimethyl-8-ribityllumazine synthase
MSTTISASLDAGKLKFALVIGRFNDFITQRLVSGACDCIKRHGGDDAAITQVFVPGSFEIPLAAKKIAESKKYDAIVALGCVIRGQTPHFEHIAGQLARGIATVSLETSVPVAFGVITADTLEQAIDRAGGKAGNKGADAATAAIEMANLLASLPK